MPLGQDDPRAIRPTASVAEALALPPDVEERVEQRDASGARQRSSFLLHGELVAEALFQADGVRPCEAWRVRSGVRHGLSVEWSAHGAVSFLQSWEDGLPHGTARQLDHAGVLLVETRFDRGTGVDLWCDVWDEQPPTLAEETRLVDGSLVLLRRWNVDERTVWMEEHYANGRAHGIFRAWNPQGRLLRGYPRYFVCGDRVDKRTYVRRTRTDPTLPVHRASDDHPERELPGEYLGQPAARRAR